MEANIFTAATFPQSATVKKAVVPGSSDTPPSPEPVYGMADDAYDRLTNMVRIDGLKAVFGSDCGNGPAAQSTTGSPHGKENKK